MLISTVGELLEILYKKGKRKDVFSIEDTATVQEAAALMARNSIKFLGVTHAGGRVRRHVGVITTTDTSSEFGASARPSERLVSDIMTRKVVAVKEGDKIDFVVNTCTMEKVRHVIVVDRVGRWKAVLSYDEAVRALMNNIAEEEKLEAMQKAEFRS